VFLALAPACGVPNSTAVSTEQQQAAALTGDIVAIPRELSADEKSKVAGISHQGLSNDNTETFYLALKRSELSQKYFLSAYLKQLYPLLTPPAFTLGTKVVTFKLQNDHVVIFDADDRKTSSATFNPDVVVESYPVVYDSKRFNSAPNANDYILIDPAAGLNRFNVVAEAFSDTDTTYSTDVQFSDRFRTVTDGVQFDQVFSGHFNKAINVLLDGVQTNAFQMSGTISMSLRKYKVSQGYTTAPMEDFYFPSDGKVQPYLSDVGPAVTAARWNIHRGMTPIKWTISSRINALAADPRYAAYDIKKAIKAGIENWNQVFGFTALTAVIGTNAVESGDDDKNVLVIDEDPTFGFAFADWRSNPNNGEIRGASVYFNSSWLDYAAYLFEPMESPTTPAIAARVAAARQVKDLSISWNGLSKKTEFRRIGADPRTHAKFDLKTQLSTLRAAGLAQAATTMTPKQKVEAYITHVIVHEIGHVLGLRHNFEGSLVPPSSSVMDYVYDPDAVTVPTPQAYDTAAVRHLYGIAPTAAPTQPFCTDEAVGFSAKCQPFDRGAKPLVDYFLPAYKAQFAANDEANNFDFSGFMGVLDYVVAGDTEAERAAAWEGLMAPLRPNFAATLTPEQVEFRGLLDAAAWNDLFLTPLGFRYSPGLAPDDVSIRSARLTQLKNELLNVDHVRAPEHRRQNIDVLKAMQTLEAYKTLLDARDALVIKKARATGNEALILSDLIARANVALNPYFK
jgi:Met-zincin